MNREEYLALTHGRLENLVSDSGFQSAIAQVRARAVQEQLLAQSADIAFTFNAEQVWKYCDFIFTEGTLLLDENFGSRGQILNWIKLAAQTFEFLSRFADNEQKELMLLNSALCYHVAGYQANARCIMRYIEDFQMSEGPIVGSERGIDAVFTRLFRDSLQNYLKHNIVQLQSASIEAKNQLFDLQSEVTQGVSEGKYGYADLFSLAAHTYFHEFAQTFCHFCLSGDEYLFDTANAHIQQSLSLFRKSSDATISTLIAEILTTLNMFRGRSTWINIEANAPNLLSDPVWRLYLRNLAQEKSIIEFWASQISAIEAGILSQSDSYVVQMPTSAGKTFVAELSILAALTSSEESKCLYIAPFRSLVSEVESSLAENLGPLGFSVSNLLGGFEFNAFEEYLAVNSRVLVATPEKVDLLVRTHPEFFEKLSVVIIDEGHIIDEGIPHPSDNNDFQVMDELDRNGSIGRGALLEFLLTRLKQKLPAVRFVFLSAVMPDINAQDFVEWLANSRQDSLRISEEERPSRQSIAKFQWKSNDNGELVYLNLPVLPKGVKPFVPRLLKREQFFTGELTPTGRRQRSSWPNISIKAETTAMLATRLVVSGPVLVFCATTSDVATVLKKLITSLKYLEASDALPLGQLRRNLDPQIESFHLAKEWLGEDDDLVEALRYGVALHYGPLPDAVRRAIENDFRSNKIRILVSTNTLGQGVNLPIKTAIIHSLERRWMSTDENGDSTNHVSQVKKRDLWNICGRAGRAGKETEGQIVFVSVSSNDSRLIDEYVEQREYEEVHSALYKLLLNLVDQRIDQSQLAGYLDSQILAVLVEELVDTDDEMAVSSWLGTSLVGIQAMRNNIAVTPLASAINSISARIQQEVSEELRSVFAATGLSVSSCFAILSAVTEFIQTGSLSPNANVDSVVADQHFVQSAFEACKALPELEFEGYIPDDEFAFVMDWINGNPVNVLREHYWTESNSTAIGTYLSERITYKLPWGFNGFLHILSYALSTHYDDLPLNWQYLPAMIKSGVNHVLACWTIDVANVSRSFAIQLAQQFTLTEEIRFPEFVSWLIDLPTEYIVEKFDIPDYEKRRLINELTNVVLDNDQLRFVRNKGKLYIEIVGTSYYDIEALQLISEGDKIELECDEEYSYDRYAVRAKWNGRSIGYVQRSKTRLLAQELKVGAIATAIVRTVQARYSEGEAYIGVEVQFNE